MYPLDPDLTLARVYIENSINWIIAALFLYSYLLSKMTENVFWFHTFVAPSFSDCEPEKQTAFILILRTDAVELKVRR
jgi:hypothetical protein